MPGDEIDREEQACRPCDQNGGSRRQPPARLAPCAILPPISAAKAQRLARASPAAAAMPSIGTGFLSLLMLVSGRGVP